MLEIGIWIGHFPYLGIFALFILGGIGLPFPEDATLLLSGFLIANEMIKPLPAFLVVYAGLLLSDFFLYSVGKKYGRKIVEHKRFHRIISHGRISKIEEKFRKWGSLGDSIRKTFFRIKSTDISGGRGDEDVSCQIPCG